MNSTLKWLISKLKRKSDAERFTEWILDLDKMYSELPDYIKQCFGWD